MKRSENWCSSWSTRIISLFSITRTVVAAMVVAVAMQRDWPPRHPSPKKSPGPRIATTASLPVWLTTDSFMPPSWMYITCLAGSPWAKTVSFLANLPTLLPRPVESRKRFTSKARFFDFARSGAGRSLADTLRPAGDTIRHSSRAGFANLFKSAQFGGDPRPLRWIHRCAIFRCSHCGRDRELPRCWMSTRFATHYAAMRGPNCELHRSWRPLREAFQTYLGDLTNLFSARPQELNQER